MNALGTPEPGSANLLIGAMPNVEESTGHESGDTGDESKGASGAIHDADQEIGAPRGAPGAPGPRWHSRGYLPHCRAGLTALKEVIREKQIRSIAIPPLGCGNGGLDWKVVRPIIQEVLGDLDTIEITVYEPAAADRGVTSTPAKRLE